MMSYAEELFLEGEIKGEIKGQIEIIEKLVHAGVSWITIEQATGLDVQKFADLKHELGRLHASSLIGTSVRPEADSVVYTDGENTGKDFSKTVNQ